MKTISIVLLLNAALLCSARPQFPFGGMSDLLPRAFDLNLNMMPEAMVDPKKVKKTTKKEKLKDGTEVTTTDINGPNFKMHEESAIQSSMSKDGKTMKKLSGPLTSAFNPTSLLLGGMPMVMPFGNPFEKKPLKCKKKCDAKKEFCDENSGECSKRLQAGVDCVADKQCQQSLLCVWGVCNKATKGNAGTLCKDTKDCGKNMNCLDTFYTTEKHCIPKLSEGAACSSSPFPKSKEENPCAEGLKCAIIGSSDQKICVPIAFKELQTLTIEDINDLKKNDKKNENKNENDNSGDDENEGDDDDNNSDDEEDENKPVTLDGAKLPTKKQDKKNNAKKEEEKKSDKKHLKIYG